MNRRMRMKGEQLRDTGCGLQLIIMLKVYIVVFEKSSFQNTVILWRPGLFIGTF